MDNPKYSTNRSAKILIIGYGENDNTMVINSNVTLSTKTFGEFVKNMEMAIRLSPTTPKLIIDSIQYKFDRTLYNMEESNFKECKDQFMTLQSISFQVKVTPAANATPLKQRKSSINNENDSQNALPRFSSPVQVRKAGSPPNRMTSERRAATPEIIRLSTTRLASPGRGIASARGSITTPSKGRDVDLSSYRSKQKNRSSPDKKSPTVKPKLNSRKSSFSESSLAIVATSDAPAVSVSAAVAGEDVQVDVDQSGAMAMARLSVASSDESIHCEAVNDTNNQCTRGIAIADTLSTSACIDRPSLDAFGSEAGGGEEVAETAGGAKERRSSERPLVDAMEAADSGDLDAKTSSVSLNATPRQASKTRRPSGTNSTTPCKPAAKDNVTAKPTDNALSNQVTPKKKPPIPLQNARKANSFSTTDANSESTEFQSHAELTQQWHQRLRGDEAPKKTDRKRGAGSGSGGGSGKEKSKEINMAMLQAMRCDTKSLLADGRPSLNTMTAQWEFMREQFVKSSEQLDWMMHAKQGGAEAYKHAHRKLTLAEDQYYKALFENDVLEAKLKLVVGPTATVPTLLKTMESCLEVFKMDPNNAEAHEQVSSARAQLSQVMEGEVNGLFSVDLEKAIKRMLTNTNNSSSAHTARTILRSGMADEISRLKERLHENRKVTDESLDEMEKWGQREKETTEYAQMLLREDDAWMERNYEANMAALYTMRSFIPSKVAEMSVVDIVEAAKACGGMLPVELATEIKVNKLLHWAVTHPADIALANFLSGEHRQYFVNIDSLDLVEMRAIRMCLPEKFELDNDGQKAEWKSRFIARLKQLVMQADGELVKGGWDFESGKRMMVALPVLKPDQCRRPIYFYRTYPQSMAKLKQYHDRQSLLEKKTIQLNKISDEYAELKKEYDTILVEMRDADFKALYGADKLSSAKDIAKGEMQEALQKQKDISSQIARIKKSIAESPLSLDEFEVSIGELKSYLAGKEVDWAEVSHPVAVLGSFPSDVEIKRVERSAAKFVTAEEEAQQRKMELTKMSVRPDSKASEASRDRDGSLGSAVVDEDLATTQNQDVTAASDFAGAQDSIYVEDAVIVDAAETLPPPPPRRGSVLATANPTMLMTLNAMLSGKGQSQSQSHSTPAKARRPSESVGTPCEGFAAATAPGGSTPSKLVVSTKSRILKRLMGETDPADEETKSADKPKMSFLQELQARKQGAPKLNFLSELALRKKE